MSLERQFGAQAVVLGGNAPVFFLSFFFKVFLSHASNAVVILDQKGLRNM